MSLTQVLGPTTPGGYRLVIVCDRNTDHSRTLEIARRFPVALEHEPWFFKVRDAVKVFAWTLYDGWDFHSKLPADGNMALLADYSQLLPSARTVLLDATAVGLAVWDLAAGHGSGGTDVFSFSTTGNAWEGHALHEWGHSHGLADEYYSGGTTPYPGPEPVAPNLTCARDLASLKWRGLVAAGTPIPTRVNEPISQPYVAPGTIGTYEGGARWYGRGVFRPSMRCRMGSANTDPFCKVCEDVIVRHLQRFVSPFEPPPIEPPKPTTMKVLVYWGSGNSMVKEIPAYPRPDIIETTGREFVCENALMETWREARKLVVP